MLFPASTLFFYYGTCILFLWIHGSGGGYTFDPTKVTKMGWNRVVPVLLQFIPVLERFRHPWPFAWQLG
jgi:hypothetical protein